MKDLGVVLRRVFRRRWLVIAALALIAGQCGLKLLLPRMMEDAVNNGVMKRDMDYIVAVGKRMAGLCLTLGACGYAGNLLCAVLGHRFARDFRDEVYAHITGLSAYQVSAFGSGTLITGLTTDIDVCAALINAMIPLAVEPLLLFVGGVAMMWSLSPAFGQAFLCFAAIQILVMVLFIRSTAPGFVKVRERMDAMNACLQSTFSSFRLTRAVNAQSVAYAKFGGRNDALFEAAYGVQRRIALFNPIVMLIMNMAVASVLWLSGREVSSGALNVGMVLAAITYSEQVLLSIMAEGQMYRRITEAQPSARRLRRILETRPELADGEKRLEGPFRELAFEDVAFDYPDGNRVLDGMSLAVRAGETVALVGPIGNGKTTLAGLCVRLADPTRGRVLLNGRDIREWSMADVRKMVALVEKHTAVLDGTVGDNLRFGREGIREEDLRAAVSAAQLDDYVAGRPEGLDAPLLSMGKSLSGGERQRLTIARALAGRPGLLVLDDATSSLDYRTERALLQAIRREYAGMAVLMVTNRPPSAAQADRVLLMDGGRIAAEGTDAALRAESPLYRSFCGIQEGRT